MSKATTDINKQIISITPDSIIELFEIDFSSIQSDFQIFEDELGINITAEAVYRFTSMINGNNPIVWNGNSYQPLPVKMDGFEHKSQGGLPRPKFSIANPQGLFSRIIYSNQDFLNCKITRKRTFARFLDEENFQNKNLNQDFENSFGKSDPRASFADDIYFINKKTLENKDRIEFELVSSLELQNAWVPARSVMSNYCNWTYRCDIGCGYKGLPIETIEGKKLTKGFSNYQQEDGGYGYVAPNRKLKDIPHWKKGGMDGFFGYLVGEVVKIIPGNSSNPYSQTPQVFVCIKEHSKPIDHHPYLDREHWLKDECNKTLEACKKRFSSEFPEFTPYNAIEGSNENDQGLKFGGFPGTESYAIE
jgi:lambda family phage minor tail protein L